ncbi:AAA family ATPase [Acidocella aminolytica]|jgi:pilus assembly protein CpaE|uniref:Pilus assembly protein n=1 Tax=Acidocella aminolytica 101 = DSM 11237 TaxID=1120923 RepID=A0A0D6PGP7_9PROT|nr:hypothetical protein [Acidocella aminolytica]GAN80822.1 pilus assembly protein [Acidocella aminolytica 101 = DSM 11237]GBQ36346.1 pilus assembly protein [Acidocella aminolytica 101 = DSM 11237]SHE32568.1 pilus assembly protein CpaE [Acidocella aminolytica 101 = DSM 11237]
MQEQPDSQPRLPAILERSQVQYNNSLSHRRPVPVASERLSFVGFLKDQDSATLLRSVLEGHDVEGVEVHQEGFRQSLSRLAGMVTPKTVLVDLCGQDQPINALMELADIIDEGTELLVVGENRNVNFYRTITKSLGVKEYLPKPLTEDALNQYFLPAIASRPRTAKATRGGRMIVLCGARSGAGTSSIVVNLGWYIATELHRHTVLLDGEINTGTLAFYLDIPPNRGLASVLTTPERVDQLLIERCVHDFGERLHVIAGLEPLSETVRCDPEAVTRFAEVIRGRYNHVVADAGARLTPLARQLLVQAQQRVIVLDATLLSLRNAKRLLQFPGGPNEIQRPLLLLNKATAPGALSRTFMENQLGQEIDVEIPDLPRIMSGHTSYGTLAARHRGPFRQAITTLADALTDREVAPAMFRPAAMAY